MREYTYGPFQSRRLKLSLGVNILLNHKICTYNCVYCELGLTNRDKIVSPEYRLNKKPTLNFRKELISILKYVPHLNSISFAGYYGEPTLNENIIDFLKIAYNVREQMKWTNDKPKLTLFTNSSTLYSEKIRDRVKQFDLVLAKLDAATDEDFARTNCPHQETADIETIIESIVKLRKEMPKGHELVIQCLIHNSYKEEIIPNNNSGNISKLAHAIKRIKPDLVQVYSVARIPSKYYVYSIDEDRKQEIVDEFRKVVNDKNVKIEWY